MEEFLVIFIVGHVFLRGLLFLHPALFVFEHFLFDVDQSFAGFFLHPILFLLPAGLALLAEERLFGDALHGRAEAVDVEALVALVADDQLYIVIVEVFLADLAGHVFETLVPLFGSDVGGPESQIPLASFGAAEAFGERGAVDIKLIVEGEFFVLLDVLECEDADANLPQNVPFLGDAVGFAGVIDESRQIALVGGVDDLALRCFHEVGASRFAVLLYSCLSEVRVS